jgi:uncharacterized protein DUF4265
VTEGPGRLKHVVFRLEPDDVGWPPVEAECLWLEPKGCNYICRTAPLFLPVAVDDEIELCETAPDGEVTKWRLVSPCDRSLLWIADTGGRDLDGILAGFREIGCNTSRSKLSVAAVDIPPEVSREQIDKLLDAIDERKYATAFPCDRQS